MSRTIFYVDGVPFVFKSEHPLEERITKLTDDYRAPDGSWILPELLAWDGVETHTGLVIGVPDDREVSK